jgi:hypothetical protein
MNARRWTMAGVLFGALLLGGSRPAAADLTTTNGCDGTGAWEKAGLNVDAATVGGKVITIPRTDTVDWEGSVTAPPGKYSGSVSVALPPPFGDWTVDSWKGDSQTTSNTGKHHYDLPTLVPAGVEFTVNGNHTDANGTCVGTVHVKLAGGVFDSPLAIVSLAGTGVTGLGAALLLRPLFRRVV